MLNASSTNPNNIPHKIKKNIESNNPIFSDNNASGKK